MAVRGGLFVDLWRVFFRHEMRVAVVCWCGSEY